MRPQAGLLFLGFCLIGIVLVVASQEKITTKEGLRNKLLKRTAALWKAQSQPVVPPAGYSGAAIPRQEDFSDYGTYPDPDANPVGFLENKDDPAERVGIIGGKKILKVIGFTLLGFLFLPILIGIPLLPIGLIFLILYNLPIVKIIDVAPVDMNLLNARSLMSFDETCIERISCQFGRKSGNYGKTLLYWIQKKFTANPIVQRISRGFEHVEDCAEYICTNPLLKRIL